MNARKLAPVAVLAGLLLAIAPAAPSFAGGSGDDPQKVAIEAAQNQGTPQNTVTAPSRLHTSGGATTQKTIGPASNTLSGFASKAAHPAGGSSSSVTTGFTTQVTWANGDTQATFNGSSYAHWLGAIPTNANKVALSDHLWCAALGVTSVNISSSPSIGLTVTGSDIVYSNTISSSWKNSHYFSGWRFSGLLFTVSETSQAAITIGSSTWIVSTP
jgi:hypothetical protein